MSQRHRIGRARYVVPRARPRWAVAKAVGAAVAIVVGTVLMVWLLRPGPDPYSGGLANRQPRASWLVSGVVAAVIAGVFAVLRARRGVLARRTIALPGVLVLVAIGAALAGVLWPGGLLRHTPEVPEMPDLGDISDEFPFDTVPTDLPDEVVPPTDDADDGTATTTAPGDAPPPTTAPATTAPPPTGSR